MSQALVVGLDLGGTKIAGALVSHDGRILTRSRTATPAVRGAGAVLDAAAALAAQLASSAPAGSRLLGIGLGAAGTIDPVTASVVAATDTLPGWAGTQLREELTRALTTGAHALPSSLWATGSPGIEAVNDVHAHALGEAWLGAAAGAPSALLVAFGTGVGGSFLTEGRPLTGAHHVAGHLGHLPSVQAAGLPCSCGAHSHLEAIASGPAVASAYARRGGNPGLDTPAVFALAAAGDPLATEVVRTAALAAGEAMAGLANAFDPHVLLVSGGLSEAGRLWWEPMLVAYREHTLSSLRATSPVAATLGGDAANLGAASLLLHRARH